LLAVAGNKYPYVRDFELMAIESLVLFDNADRDVQPDLLIDLPGEQVRQSFVDPAQDFGASWFGDQQE